MKLARIMKTGLLQAEVTPKELQSAIRGITPAEDWLYMYSDLSCREEDRPPGTEMVGYKPGAARRPWDGNVPKVWVGVNGTRRDCSSERRVLIRSTPTLSFWLVASYNE